MCSVKGVGGGGVHLPPPPPPMRLPASFYYNWYSAKKKTKKQALLQWEEAVFPQIVACCMHGILSIIGSQDIL